MRVFEQEAMSSRVKVRADGKVALPFLGETGVRGKRPSDVARELETKLKEYVLSPKVTVNVDEYQPINVAVIGEVSHPGSYPLEATSGVMQALASAGGMTEYADRDRIFVLRKTPALRRIRFTFDSLLAMSRDSPQPSPSRRATWSSLSEPPCSPRARPPYGARDAVPRIALSSRTAPRFAVGISASPMTPR